MATQRIRKPVVSGSDLSITARYGFAFIDVALAKEIVEKVDLFSGQLILEEQDGDVLVFRNKINVVATQQVLTVQVVYKATEVIRDYADQCEEDAKNIVFALIDDMLKAHDRPKNVSISSKPPEEKSSKKDDQPYGSGGQGGTGGGDGNKGRNRDRNKGGQQGGGN